MENPDLNLLAVVASAIAAFGIGALWYSPAVLGRQWAAAHGHTPETIAGLRQRAGRVYGVSFVCYVVMAAVLAVLLQRIGVQNALTGVKLGGLCWLGFAATLGLTANRFSEKRLSAWVIDAGYQLVILVCMGIILAVWR